MGVNGAKNPWLLIKLISTIDPAYLDPFRLA
jgi:hypothetical protein